LPFSAQLAILFKVHRMSLLAIHALLPIRQYKGYF
jgi:hypothetical protein